MSDDAPPLPRKPRRVGRYKKARSGDGNGYHYAVTVCTNDHTDETTSNMGVESAETLNDRVESDMDSSPEYKPTDELCIQIDDQQRQNDDKKQKQTHFCSKLFLSSRKEYRVIKSCFSILISLLFGVALYYAFIFGYRYERPVAGGIAMASTCVMSLFFALSIKARCVGVLAIPSLCTARGRTAILSFIAGLLLMGPMINIAKNLENVAHGLGCSIQATQNLSDELRAIYTRSSLAVVDKLTPVIYNLQSHEEMLADDFSAVERFVNDWKRKPSDTEVCQQEMNRVYKICEWEMDQAGQRCRDALYRIDPRLLSDGDPCKLGSTKQSCRARLRNLCSRTISVSSRQDRIKASIANLRTLLDDLKTDVRIEYNTTSFIDNVVVNKSSSESEKIDDVRQYIHSKAQTAIYIIKLIQIIGKACSMSVILLLVQSFLYLRDYLTKDTFDNCYITRQVKLLDAKNRANHKPGILPLRKAERRYYVDSTTFRLSVQEKDQFKHGLATLCLHIVAGSIVCIFDYFLFWVMHLMQDQVTDDELLLSNANDVGNEKIRVTGSGFLARTLSEVVSTLTETPHRRDLRLCIESPHEPSYTKYYIIATAYVIAFTLVFTQAYFMRLRRKVVAYFYPEREEERDRYLIERIVRKRQDFTKRLTRNIQRTVRERRRAKKEQMNVAATVKKVIVALFCWKVSSPAHCLVCDDVDKGTFYHCLTSACGGVYCRECFRDVRNVCQFCFVHETV